MEEVKVRMPTAEIVQLPAPDCAAPGGRALQAVALFLSHGLRTHARTY